MEIEVEIEIGVKREWGREREERISNCISLI